MSAFSHSHTVFLNRDVATGGPRQVSSLEGVAGGAFFPLKKDLTGSKKDWLKVLTRVVSHIWKCVGRPVGCHSDWQVRWQGRFYWNLVG